MKKKLCPREKEEGGPATKKLPQKGRRKRRIKKKKISQWGGVGGYKSVLVLVGGI